MLRRQRVPAQKVKLVGTLSAQWLKFVMTLNAHWLRVGVTLNAQWLKFVRTLIAQWLKLVRTQRSVSQWLRVGDDIQCSVAEVREDIQCSVVEVREDTQRSVAEGGCGTQITRWLKFMMTVLTINAQWLRVVRTPRSMSQWLRVGDDINAQ